MGVILTVPALWADVPANFIPDLPGTRIKVAYNNSWFSNACAEDGRKKLITAMIANKGTPEDPTNIFGWSMGGQVIHKTLRESSALLLENGITPETAHFWTVGNPEHNIHGASIVDPVGHRAVYPGTTAHGTSCPTPQQYHGGHHIGYGLPLDCPWFVDECAMPEDGWCNGTGNTGGNTNTAHQSYDLFTLAGSIIDEVDAINPNVQYRVMA